jgi:hypothetical protein
MFRAVIVASLTVLVLSQAIPVDSAAAAPPVPPSDSKRPPPIPMGSSVRPRTPGWTPVPGFTGQKSSVAAASGLLLPCAVCTYKAPLLTIRK